MPILTSWPLISLIFLLALTVCDKLPALLIFSGPSTAAVALRLPVATGMYATTAISLLSQTLTGTPITGTSANPRNLNRPLPVMQQGH